MAVRRELDRRQVRSRDGIIGTQNSYHGKVRLHTIFFRRGPRDVEAREVVAGRESDS